MSMINQISKNDKVDLVLNHRTSGFSLVSKPAPCSRVFNRAGMAVTLGSILQFKPCDRKVSILRRPIPPSRAYSTAMRSASFSSFSSYTSVMRRTIDTRWMYVNVSRLVYLIVISDVLACHYNTMKEVQQLRTYACLPPPIYINFIDPIRFADSISLLILACGERWLLLNLY